MSLLFGGPLVKSACFWSVRGALTGQGRDPKNSALHKRHAKDETSGENTNKPESTTVFYITRRRGPPRGHGAGSPWRGAALIRLKPMAMKCNGRHSEGDRFNIIAKKTRAALSPRGKVGTNDRRSKSHSIKAMIHIDALLRCYRSHF